MYYGAAGRWAQDSHVAPKYGATREATSQIILAARSIIFEQRSSLDEAAVIDEHRKMIPDYSAVPVLIAIPTETLRNALCKRT